MAAQPAIDLTDVDLVPAFRQASRITRGAARGAAGLAGRVAKDTTYTAVGLGLLTWQRLQVRRRELERATRTLPAASAVLKAAAAASTC